MPPERKAPSGTSATSWSLTACASSLSVSSASALDRAPLPWHPEWSTTGVALPAARNPSAKLVSVSSAGRRRAAGHGCREPGYAAPAGLEGEVVAQAFGIELAGKIGSAKKGARVDATTSPPACSPQNSGLMPSRSRARNTLPSSRSWMAKANMPSSLVHYGLAPVQVTREQNFAVGPGGKGTPGRFEFAAQRG
jgi:hypothetical protein